MQTKEDLRKLIETAGDKVVVLELRASKVEDKYDPLKLFIKD